MKPSSLLACVSDYLNVMKDRMEDRVNDLDNVRQSDHEGFIILTGMVSLVSRATLSMADLEASYESDYAAWKRRHSEMTEQIEVQKRTHELLQKDAVTNDERLRKEIQCMGIEVSNAKYELIRLSHEIRIEVSNAKYELIRLSHEIRKLDPKHKDAAKFPKWNGEDKGGIAPIHFPHDVRFMVAINKLILAIKLMREYHDLGLADAKWAVEYYQRHFQMVGYVDNVQEFLRSFPNTPQSAYEHDNAVCLDRAKRWAATIRDSD